jgi:chromosome segregation ATPase
LTRDAEALRHRIEQDRHDNGAARAALEIALHEREQELEKQRQLVEANERDFAERRRQLAEREQAAHDLRHRIEEQRDELAARDRDLEDCRQRLRDLTQALAEREEQTSAATADFEQLRATVAAQGEEIESLRETAAASERELEELRSALADAQTRLTDTESRLAEAQAQAEAAARDMDSAREQLAGLEAELKEERENAESLGELANERREHMTKLQEQVEEAEERYADANWRLGKSLYFERLVKRRKGLIKKLLDALRAKMKANQALKAGVDGLRTYKQTADMNQHKLLQRIDGLKAELQEAQEVIKRHEGGTAANEEVTAAVSRAAELEARLNTQAELIQSLEADLKAARLAQKSTEAKEAKSGKTQEVEKLAKELEAKNQTIAELQVYADEQQKKLARLRTSESETMRLKALNEKERGEIEVLQTEVTQLREALDGASEKATAQFAAKVSALESKLKEREGSIARLMATIKEHETTIKKLTESSESWKRKYQFLASDQPDAYKSAAEK